MRRASPTTAARIANYAAVPPALRTNTGFSETQAGFAGGVFFLAYAIGSPIFVGVYVEMIAAGKVLIFNILNEANKPLPASGVSGAVLLTSGNDRETLPLVISGNALKAEAKGDIVKGASVTVTLKTAAGKSGLTCGAWRRSARPAWTGCCRSWTMSSSRSCGR
ncbi:hypothetical protein [Tardiphaga sp. 42S5]|uniref:hypothetical protein n=1 Tax=Tardiphaga sp. 42S5 TaxID=1404799 RepID=UPI002A5AE332|nr:hypothetical protein [Tardiphaga sp. 42S5]WPO39796.1 hypothetical protein SFY93_19885 [Tardiphaga sp. 42S5]